MTTIIQWCNDNQGFLSAVLSLVAVFAAIGIPTFIAYRQNRIALFDKRFEVYVQVRKIISFWEHINIMPFPEFDPRDYQIWCLIHWTINQRENSIFELEDSLVDCNDTDSVLEAKRKYKVIDKLNAILDLEIAILNRGELLYKGSFAQNIGILANTYNDFLISLFDGFRHSSSCTVFAKRREAFFTACEKIVQIIETRSNIRSLLRY